MIQIDDGIFVDKLPDDWILNYPIFSTNFPEGLNPISGSFEAFSVNRPDYLPTFEIILLNKTYVVDVTNIRTKRVENGYHLECDFEDTATAKLLNKQISVSFTNTPFSDVVDWFKINLNIDLSSMISGTTPSEHTYFSNQSGLTARMYKVVLSDIEIIDTVNFTLNVENSQTPFANSFQAIKSNNSYYNFINDSSANYTARVTFETLGEKDVFVDRVMEDTPFIFENKNLVIPETGTYSGTFYVKKGNIYLFDIPILNNTIRFFNEEGTFEYIVDYQVDKANKKIIINEYLGPDNLAISFGTGIDPTEPITLHHNGRVQELLNKVEKLIGCKLQWV